MSLKLRHQQVAVVARAMIMYDVFLPVLLHVSLEEHHSDGSSGGSVHRYTNLDDFTDVLAGSSVSSIVELLVLCCLCSFYCLSNIYYNL